MCGTWVKHPTQNMASHHIWAAKSSLFAFVSSIFLLIMSYFYRQILCSFCPWLLRVSEQSLTMSSLLISARSSFWSWDCGKWRTSRHASIDMRACHCSKSRWVRLFEENIKKTIPMIGTFSFWFLSEFSLQCLPPAYTLGVLSVQKWNTRHWRPQPLWEKRVTSTGWNFLYS